MNELGTRRARQATCQAWRTLESEVAAL